MDISNPAAFGPNSITDLQVQALNRMAVFGNSGTFVAPKTGNYFVLICGGGGGGGAGGGSIAANTAFAEGGLGGLGGQVEFAIVAQNAGDHVNVVIGVGGSGAAGNAGLAGDSGTDGSQSSYGAFPTANGGQGGRGAPQSDSTIFYIANGTPGGGWAGGQGGHWHAIAGAGNPGTIGQSFGSGGGGGSGSTADNVNAYAGGGGGDGQKGFCIILW